MTEENDPIHEIENLTEHTLGISTLERYTGSSVSEFQPYILLTNFHGHVQEFSRIFKNEMTIHVPMSTCHAPQEKITIINYGVGSPVAALVIELLSLIQPKAVLAVGLCGGLRPNYEIGHYFNPVAAIRGEGTSDSFMPPQSPALSSFVIQRYVCEELERRQMIYHSGVIHTTNVRFWEFKEDFKAKLEEEKVQAIDMECATLFTVGFAKYVAVGTLLIISDLPLVNETIKTKERAKAFMAKYSNQQLEVAISILKNMMADEKKGFGYQF